MKMTQMRDIGPYNGRYITKGAMIAEAGNLIGALTSGLPLAGARARVLDGTLFPQRARASRERMWDVTSYTHLFGHTWVLTELQQT